MPLDLDALEAVARAATPHENPSASDDIRILHEYLSLASPTTILALISRIRVLEKAACKVFDAVSDEHGRHTHDECFICKALWELGDILPAGQSKWNAPDLEGERK